MAKKGIISKLAGILKRMVKAAQDLHYTYKFQQEIKEERCLVVTPKMVYDVKCKNIDNEYIKPHGFSMTFAIKHIFIKWPENITYYLVHVNWPFTFHPNDPPIYEEIEKAKPDITLDEDGNQAVTISPHIYEKVLGGKELALFMDKMSEIAFFKHIHGKPGNEMLIIVITIGILGFLLGAPVWMFFFSLLF